MTAAPGNGSSDAGLRVLAADEDRAALESTAAVLRGLGHEVTSYAIGVGEHARGLIRELGEFASGPVIALLEGEVEQLQGALERRMMRACAGELGDQKGGILMVGLLITILVAILAYWLLVPVAGLPVIVGAVAAILVLLGGFRGGGVSAWR